MNKYECVSYKISTRFTKLNPNVSVLRESNVSWASRQINDVQRNIRLATFAYKTSVFAHREGRNSVFIRTLFSHDMQVGRPLRQQWPRLLCCGRCFDTLQLTLPVQLCRSLHLCIQAARSPLTSHNEIQYLLHASTSNNMFYTLTTVKLATRAYWHCKTNSLLTFFTLSSIRFR